MLWIILVVFILFFLWFFLDIYLGRKFHISNTIKREYPERFGNPKFFGKGQPLYDSLFNDIQQAHEHIHILFYIIKNDKVSKDFLSLLRKKAEAGIKVRLLVDRVGGSKLSKIEIDKLQKSGVSFSYSNTPSFPFFFYSLNYRNHRKITIIDGTIGYFGGYNIGKEYLGKDPNLGDWRDFHLKLVGDGVQDLQVEFMRDWKIATKERITVEKQVFKKGPTSFHFLPSEGIYIHEIIINLIKKAKKEIIIGSPYFIPSKQIMNALLNARDRDVTIKIIVPYKGDHALVKEAAFPFFKDLLFTGCHIYQYQKGFYHSKIIIIDDEVCDIGTANFDKRSLFINKELNCMIRDKAFINKIKAELKEDISCSRRLTVEDYKKRPLSHRSKELLAKVFNPFL